MKTCQQSLLSRVQSLTAPHDGVSDGTRSHFSRSQSRDLSGVYFEGDTERARGKTSVVMSNQSNCYRFRETKET